MQQYLLPLLVFSKESANKEFTWVAIVIIIVITVMIYLGITQSTTSSSLTVIVACVSCSSGAISVEIAGAVITPGLELLPCSACLAPLATTIEASLLA